MQNNQTDSVLSGAIATILDELESDTIPRNRENTDLFLSLIDELLAKPCNHTIAAVYLVKSASGRLYRCECCKELTEDPYFSLQAVRCESCQEAAEADEETKRYLRNWRN